MTDQEHAALLRRISVYEHRAQQAHILADWLRWNGMQDISRRLEAAMASNPPMRGDAK